MTSLSPEAVEALATSLAVKLGIKERTDADLADKFMAFDQEAKARQREDDAFKKEVREALRDLKRNKSDLPTLSVILAIVAMIFSSVSIVATARATEKLTNDIRDIREHLGPSK